MDNFKGGKFIVGTDVKADESRRMANELFRNQNENYRMANENARTEATITNKNSFFTQIGLFVMVIVVIIILLVIAILAYEKATNNQSLVNLNNLRDLTLSNLTVNDTSTLKTLTLSGDTTSSGSATYSGELNVTGAVDFDNKLDVASGLSVSGGLSIDGETNLYDDLRVYEGVSIDGGLSVSGETNLYDDLRVYEGVSIDKTLKVTGQTDIYTNSTVHASLTVDDSFQVGSSSVFVGDIRTFSGVSIDGGLSVGSTAIIEKAKIKKDNIIKTDTLSGISTGYKLDLDETGNTYVILNKNSEGVSVPNSFILPTLSGATENGARYKFLWSGDNLSESHKHFTIQTDISNNLYGTVVTAKQGSSVITMASNSTTENVDVHGIPGISTTQFHYDGTLYPGSRLECTYLDNHWLLDGQLGTSGDNTTNNGFIDLHKPDWLAAGVSSMVQSTYLLSSFNGSHYYPVNVQYDKTPYFYDLASGTSGDGTDITTGVGLDTSYNGLGFLYSSNGVSWKSGIGAGQNLQGYAVAYGSSSGTSVWVASGVNPDGNNILYSTDGISWREGTGLDLVLGLAVGYGLSSDGASIWVAGGTESTGKNLLYSSDGISWQNSTGSSFGSEGRIETVAYGLSSDRTSIWLAGGINAINPTNNILYSEDGVSWKLTTGANISSVVEDIAFGLSSDGTSLWVATGYDEGSGNNIIYSVDGVSWENALGTLFGSNGIGNNVVFGKDNNDSNLWVAGGFNADNNSKNILTSTDGQNWSTITSGDSMIINGVDALAYTDPLYPNHDNPVEN